MMASRFKTIETAGVPIYFEESDRDTARVVADTVSQTMRIVMDRWALPIPASCRVYVLTTWEAFLSDSVPFWLRLPVWLCRPLWHSRVNRAHELAGGWMLPWPGRPCVGVKTPEQLSKTKLTLGDRLFKPVANSVEKVRHITCHEFTHACSAHLRLPPWLNEGLAMRAVDHLVGHGTVMEETREVAEIDPIAVDSRAYRRISVNDHDTLIRLYAAGYWATRRIDEESPDRLAQLLSKRRPRSELEGICREILGAHLAYGGAV